MAEYRLTINDAFVQRTEDGAFIPDDELNRDWIAYQDWLANGGVPDPFEPTPSNEPRDALAEADRANDRLDAGVEAAAGSVERAKQLRDKPATTGPDDPVTQAQLDALQAQVNALQDAVTAMLQAQGGITPTTNPHQ